MVDLMVGPHGRSVFTNRTALGNVDLVRSGDFGITCAGSSGSCIHLDGVDRPGGPKVAGCFCGGAGPGGFTLRRRPGRHWPLQNA